MGLSMLPDELMLSLSEQWPCRDTQLKQLAALLAPSFPSPSSLVIYGPRATGKSSIVQAYLQSSKLLYASVQCRECVTGRHLLERIVAAIYESLQTTDTADHVEDHGGRCENLGSLSVHLQNLLKNRSKFVLVLDGIDRQREAAPTLLPALARLGESIPQLTILSIVSYAPPRFFHQAGIEHIYFGPYSRNQSIHILSRAPPDIFLEAPPEDMDYDDETHEEDKAWLWPRFCAAVWDALAQGAARDLTAYRDVCHKLWRTFIAPVVKGDFGTRDFSRLLVAQRRLFQEEASLLDTIVQGSDSIVSIGKHRSHELPYYAKWMLVAAYLASFNPARLDALYFMKTTEKKRRKKGGGTARSGGRPSQTRKIPRHLLAASAFPLDRLLGVLHAILPDDIKTSVDVYKQIATLSSLRLLVRAGGIGSSDSLEASGKWRVGPMVTWEHAQSLARSVDFNLIDYVAD